MRVHVDGPKDPIAVRAAGKDNTGRDGRVFISPELKNLHKFDSKGLRITR